MAATGLTQPVPARSNGARVVPVNSASRALVRIGDRWSILIMAAAFCGAHRFDDWRKGIGISSNILTNRLTQLTELGCLERVPLDNGKRQAYRLTDMGRALFPNALMFWRFDHFWSTRQPPLIDALTHESCGRPMMPTLVCASCQEAIDPREVSFADGPGAGTEPMPPQKSSRRSNMTLDHGSTANLLFGESVDYLGDRWTQVILASLFLGDRRYEQVRSRWHIGTNTLADRLRLLTDNGLLRRSVYQTNPERSEYELTAKGMDIYPIILTLNAWGDRWLSPPDKPPLILTHLTCGALLRPVVVCDQCLVEVDVRDVTFHRRDTG